MASYYLTEDDKKAIKMLLDKGSISIPKSGYTPSNDLNPSSDVWLAQANNKIDALVVCTDVGDDIFDTPGVGTFTRYSIAWDSSDELKAYPMEDDEFIGYNFYTSDIQADTWVLLVADKFKKFIARVFDEGWDRCTCNLLDDLAGESTCYVNNVFPIKGGNPTSSTDEPLLVYNTHGWEGDGNTYVGTGTGSNYDSLDGGLGRIEYNITSGHWELYQLTCPT